MQLFIVTLLLATTNAYFNTPSSSSYRLPPISTHRPLSSKKPSWIDDISGKNTASKKNDDDDSSSSPPPSSSSSFLVKAENNDERPYYYPQVFKPLFRSEIVKKVPKEAIGGAMLFSLASFLIITKSIELALVGGLVGGYTAIHPGVLGDSLREIGFFISKLGVFDGIVLLMDDGKIRKEWDDDGDGVDIADNNITNWNVIEWTEKEEDELRTIRELLAREKKEQKWLDSMDDEEMVKDSEKKSRKDNENEITAEKIADGIVEKERIDIKKLEDQEQLALEKDDKKRKAAEEAEKGRIAADKAEKERIATEKAKEKRVAAEKAEKERIAADKAETERIATDKAEKERMAAEKAEKERIAAEKAEKERIAAEKAEKKRIVAEKAERERIAAEKAEKERVAAEKTEKERIAAEKAEKKRVSAEKAEKERIAAEKAEKKRIAVEKAEREQIAAEKAEKERVAAEKERIAAEKAEKERIAVDEAERGRIAAETAEKERITAEKVKEEQKAAEIAELKRLMNKRASEIAEQKRIAAEKAAEGEKIIIDESVKQKQELAKKVGNGCTTNKLAGLKRKLNKNKVEEKEQAAAEKKRFALQKAEQKRIRKEEVKAQRRATQKAEQERIVAEKKVMEKIIAIEKAEREKKLTEKQMKASATKEEKKKPQLEQPKYEPKWMSKLKEQNESTDKVEQESTIGKISKQELVGEQIFTFTQKKTLTNFLPKLPEKQSVVQQPKKKTDSKMTDKVAKAYAAPDDSMSVSYNSVNDITIFSMLFHKCRRQLQMLEEEQMDDIGVGIDEPEYAMGQIKDWKQMTVGEAKQEFRDIQLRATDRKKTIEKIKFCMNVLSNEEQSE